MQRPAPRVPFCVSRNVKTVLTEQQIRSGIKQLAGQISKHYGPQPLTIVGVLTGSIVLLADLMRLMEIPAQIRIVQPVIDHSGPDRPTQLCLDSRTAEAIRNHHVVVVDDVFVTGFTLLEMLCQVDQFGPLSVRSAVLVRKVGPDKPLTLPDLAVFQIPPTIVVGYGLDYHGRYRHLSHIAELEPHDITPQRKIVSPATKGNSSALAT